MSSLKLLARRPLGQRSAQGAQRHGRSLFLIVANRRQRLLMERGDAVRQQRWGSGFRDDAGCGGRPGRGALCRARRDSVGMTHAVRDRASPSPATAGQVPRTIDVSDGA